MNEFIKEFKEFIMRGNVMDMAVGVIIGGTFQSIVIMPVITKITGGIDFKNWFISLDGGSYSTLADAQKAGAATLNYGVFITAVIQFLIMAFVIFSLVKTMNAIAAKTTKPVEPTAPTTKTCPYCKSEIAIDC